MSGNLNGIARFKKYKKRGIIMAITYKDKKIEIEKPAMVKDLFAEEIANTSYIEGTTCELVFVKDRTVHVVHVGDSRTYSIRGGKIKQLTEDHSVVQEMVRRGELTPEQAQNHPNKNIITRALGIRPDVTIDYIEANFTYGDVILSCSDGLTNCVTNGDIVKIVHENRGESLVNTLVEKAKEGGGTDNITVNVIY